MRDLSESELAALRPGGPSDSHLSALFDQPAAGFAEADLDGRLIRANARYCELVGRPVEQLIGQRIADVTHPEDREDTAHRFRRMVESGEPFTVEKRYLRPDGTVTWAQVYGSAVRSPDGRIIGAAAVVVDTTDARSSEQALRESEARLRALVTATSDVVYRMSADWTEMIQLDGRGFIADTDQPRIRWIDEYIFPEDHDFVMAAIEETIRTRGTFQLEHRVRRVDGSVGWTFSRAIPLLDERGEIEEWLGLASDITPRKQAEQALLETTQRLNAIINNTRMAVFMMDDRQHCVFMNKAAEELTGYTFEETQGRPLHDVVHHQYPDGRPYPLHECPIDRAFPEDDQVQGEEVFVHKDGHFYPVAFTASPMRNEAGESIGTVLEAKDITKERMAQQALRESEARFREVANAAPVLIWLADTGNKGTWYNKAWLDFTGRTMEQELGDGWIDSVHPDDRARAAEICGSAFDQRKPFRLDFRMRRADGEWRVIDDSGVPRFAEDGTFLGYIGSCIDVTDARSSEEALREQSRILETLNRTGAAVAGELDLQKLVQMVTDAGVELTGAEFGAFFYNVIDHSGESYMLYTLSGAEPSQFDFGMPRNTAVFQPTFGGEGPVRSDDITKDPRYGKNPPHNGMPKGHLPVRSYLAVPVISRSGEVIGGLFFGHHEIGRFTESHERLMTGLASQAAVSIDNARLYQALQRANETLEQRVQERTAELATANEALRQAQKMEAIGQLTGGIAHDFNNMLTVIRGSADVLQRGLGDEAKRQRYVQAIAETADRAARLTSQLLAFARRQALKPEVFDVNERVDAIADMLRTVLGSRIRLTISSDCEDCFVEADSAQFETALVNMAVNARDAMSGEGELRIEVGRVDKLPDGAAQAPEAGYVTVKVADTGEGIAAETLDRIFEPFFTTKETGKGTGLGLSQVYGFAKQSGGEIDVASEPGRGTSFTLYLPGSSSSEAAERAVPQASAEHRAEGRVLVVEDNEHVGRFAEQVLAEIGFETCRAASGAEALELLESGERFDVVFSDVVMPGLDGIQLASEIRRRWPGLPVILTTGYSDVLALSTDHKFPILHKPYSLEALSSAIGQAISQ